MGQIFQSLPLDRALADTDLRNRFVFSGVYELPFGKGKRFANNFSKASDKVIGGWQLNTIVTIQSGLPFYAATPGSPSDARPDAIGNLDTHPGNTQRILRYQGSGGRRRRTAMASCSGRARWAQRP